MECQFSIERSKVKVTGRQKPQEIDAYKTYMFTYERLQTRPKPLLGLIYCRRLARSATGQTAAYNTSTRRQQIFLLHP